MSMERIRRKDVPMYLRNGAFFENLDSSDEDMFEVPSNCFKTDETVANNLDLTFVLRSARFWGLDEPPLSVVSYIVRNGATLRSEDIFAERPEFATFLKNAFDTSQQSLEDVVFAAIKVGFGLRVVEHLHNHDGFPLTPKAFLAAAVLDDLNSLQWLLRQGCEWPEHIVMTMLRYGSLQCLKFALENGQPLPEGAITNAAMFQQLDVLQHLIAIGLKPESYTMQCVLSRGNVKVIRTLHQAGCALSVTAMFTFVMYNHLDCLIYAHESGCAWTADLCATAAGCGHLRCLEYLHHHGCPWDASTLIMAAKRAHIECLVYAHQRGCPMSPLVTLYALNHCSFECALYGMWHGAMSNDVKHWCVSVVCVVCLNTVLCFSNRPVMSVWCVAFVCACYYTTKVFEMTIGSTRAKLARHMLVVAVMYLSFQVLTECYANLHV